jgi:hypothetical protein
MAAIAITEDEVLEALAIAAPGRAPENARTTEELALAAGVSHDVVNSRIRALSREGRVMVHTVYRENVVGKRIQKPAYTILPAKKKR